MKKDFQLYINALKTQTERDLFDPIYLQRNISEYWEDIKNDDLTKSKRIVALFAILKRFIPDTLFHTITKGRLQYQQDILPISPKLYSLEEKKIGSGYQCTVYKLLSRNPNNPTLVAKFEKDRGDMKSLLERAKQLRSEYEKIQSWYTSIPDVIPEEFHFIGRTPFGGRKGVITIQKFFGDPSCIKDIFREISTEHLLEILQRNPSLEKTFRAFVENTLSQLNKDGNMIDTIGENNVALIEDENEPRLILLDPHMIYSPEESSDENRKILLADIKYLEKIVSDLNTSKMS